MSFLQSFATRVRALREERGISQEQLSRKLGISRVSLGFYEKKERTPDIEMLGKVASYFKVSTDYLLGLSEFTNVDQKADISKGYTDLVEETQLYPPKVQKEFTSLFEAVVRSYSSLNEYGRLIKYARMTKDENYLDAFYLSEMRKIHDSLAVCSDDACIIAEGIYHGALEHDCKDMYKSEIIRNSVKHEGQACEGLALVFHEIKLGILDQLHEHFGEPQDTYPELLQDLRQKLDDATENDEQEM